MSKRGTFITFEGIDGCGKTTQLRLLGERFRALGREVVETVEPGGTEIGRQIRRILLDPENAGLRPGAELLLYFASRAQNVEQVIQPALVRGDLVLCDRFTDSTLAYQGCGRGLDAESILQLDRLACAGLRPDVTVLIDVDPEMGLARLRARNALTGSGETRIDDEGEGFHRRVREGYLALARQHPERIVRVDGTGRMDLVAEEVWKAVGSDV